MSKLFHSLLSFVPLTVPLVNYVCVMSMTNDFDLVPNLLQKLIRVVIKKLLGRITNLVVVASYAMGLILTLDIHS